MTLIYGSYNAKHEALGYASCADHASASLSERICQTTDTVLARSAFD